MNVDDIEFPYFRQILDLFEQSDFIQKFRKTSNLDTTMVCCAFLIYNLINANANTISNHMFISKQRYLHKGIDLF